MQILDGVYQLLTPFPHYTYEEAMKIRKAFDSGRPKEMRGLPYVLPYMIKSGGELILVDCGWNTDAAYDALTRGMADHDTHPSEITKLVITHIHPDHYGMSGRVKQVSNCDVVMHQAEANVVNSRYITPIGLADQMYDYMQQHGVPALDSSSLSRGSMDVVGLVQPAPPDKVVEHNERITCGSFDFEVKWTPGHTPGHICLYEPNYKILLTGDHILPTITPNISMHPQAGPNPLGDYIKSLDVVGNLDVDYVLPAHEYDIKELKKRIDEIHVHHKERLEEMLRCIDTGGSTAWEVAGRVKWATGTMKDFEPFQQRAAVGETLSHLEYLFEEEQLSKVKHNGKVMWVKV